MQGLTEIIFERKPPTHATEHPFLLAAAAGTLHAQDLALWLYQDRIYAAQAYPRFIGSLIAKIPFEHFHDADSPEYSLEQKILELLANALMNIVDEVKFFDETARKYGLELRCWKERKATRDYTAEMIHMGSPSVPLGEGLVFLWAMERVRRSHRHRLSHI